MNPLLHALPLDLTGKAVNNLVRGEPHDLSTLANLPNRCFVLNHGYFYKASLELVDATGQPLFEGIDYQVTSNSRTLQAKTGLAVPAVVVITNAKVSPQVYATAQMVGGAEGAVDQAIVDTATDVLNANGAVRWVNVTGKPDDYDASGHLHAMYQLYGFEGWISSSDNIALQIRRKAAGRYGVIQADYDTRLAAISAQKNNEDAKLATHIANTDNPHVLTAKQVSLDLVRNYGVATTAETSVAAPTSTVKYITPLGGANVITANFTKALNTHIADKANPHGLTAAQVSAYLTQEVNNLLANKLGLQETAVNSNLLQGVTWPQLYANFRAQLTAAMIQAAGRFNQARLGRGQMDASTVLTGAQNWRAISELFTTFSKPATSIYYVEGVWNDNNGDTGFNYVSSAFANYPVGTLVIYTNQHVIYGYNGNGTGGTPVLSLFMAAKTASGWIH